MIGGQNTFPFESGNKKRAIEGQRLIFCQIYLETINLVVHL
jgi:hypothetical protein